MPITPAASAAGIFRDVLHVLFFRHGSVARAFSCAELLFYFF